MRYFAYFKLFSMIFNKKKLPNLAWIERQGLLFVKVAQTFALRIDFLSPEKTMHLQQLYTHATPVAYDSAQLKQTLPKSLLENIQHIDEKPIGVASVGQVYKATLQDGSIVAIKIIKKDVKEAFKKEVKSFKSFIRWMIRLYPKLQKVADPLGIIEHIETYTLQELDLRNEIKHTALLKQIKAQYEAHFDFSTLHFPTYIESFCTQDVLVSLFVEGIPVSQALREKTLPQDKMLDIFRWHGFYMFIVGVFHGDIHPGNIMFHENGFTLIDTGALSEVSKNIQQGLFEFMKSLSTYDYVSCAKHLNEMAIVSIHGKKYLEFEKDFLKLYDDFAGHPVSKKSLTKQMMHTIKLGVHAGMTFEKGMFPIIKSLMYLDGIVLMGAPDLELMKEMRTFIHTFEEAKYHVQS
jgi:ubiquinone biosynthesis protein